MSTFVYEQDGQKKTTSQSFYRGENTNFYPTPASLKVADAIDKYIIAGWKPAAPFLAKETPVVAFGSCFATNISTYLHDRGYNVLTKKDNKAYVTKMGDGMVNTFAILQQFEWAWLNKVPEGDLWHGYKAEEFGYGEEVRLVTKQLFDEAEMFIITLGLSEIWYDEPTEEVFWRAVPKDKFDASRHKFRVSTFEETLRNINAIYEIIRRFRPEAKIMFSVSPIPLTATFRSVSAIAANSVSKAIIRAAFDQFYRDRSPKDSSLYYFPSYEAVSHVYRNQWGMDGRHVAQSVLHFNMAMFEHYFCTPGIPTEQLQQIYQQSLVIDERIGREGHLNQGKSYEEIRERTKQVKRQQRIDARIAERAQARQQATEIRKANAEKIRQSQKIKQAASFGWGTLSPLMSRIYLPLATAAAGFAANGLIGLSFFGD